MNISDTTKNVVSGSGPFVMTSHNGSGIFSNLTTVTWNVATTVAASINATKVKMLLSANGGLSFPITTEVTNDCVPALQAEPYWSHRLGTAHD